MSLHRRLDEQTVLVTAVIVVCSFCLWFRFTSTPIRLQRNWAGNHYPHGEGVKGHSCQPWNLTSIGVQFLGMLCTEFFLENCFRKLLLNILCRKVLPRILLLLNLLHSTTTSLYVFWYFLVIILLYHVQCRCKTTVINNSIYWIRQLQITAHHHNWSIIFSCTVSSFPLQLHPSCILHR